MEPNTPGDREDQFDMELAYLSEPLFAHRSPREADFHLNAQLRPDAGWHVYAYGYKQAADSIVEMLLDNGESDINFLVYPIIFLYRHYLELRLKELLLASSLLLDKSVNLPKNHNLLTLWKIARPGLEEIWDHEDPTYWKSIDSKIVEFTEIDENSTTFRYPIDNEAEPNFSEIRTVNLKHIMVDPLI